MGPRAAVALVVLLTSSHGCACWNGFPCCPGVVTISLANAAISAGGRSFKGPVCVGPVWGNTGTRVAMGVTGCCSGTPKKRLLACSRAVSCPRKLNNRYTLSSENSWVVLFDRLCRALRGSTGTERQAKLRNASLPTNLRIHFWSLFRASACASLTSRGRRSAGLYLALDPGYSIVQ